MQIETYSEPTDAGAFHARLAEIMLQTARIPEEVELELQPTANGTALYILATSVASMPDKAFAAVAKFLKDTRGISMWKAKDKIEVKRDELRTYLIRDLAEGGRLGPELVTHAGALLELEQHAKRVAAEKAAAAAPPAKKPRPAKPSRAAIALAARRAAGETQEAAAAAMLPPELDAELAAPIGGGAKAARVSKRTRRAAPEPELTAPEEELVDLEHEAPPEIEAALETFKNDATELTWIDRLADGDQIELAWTPKPSKSTRRTLGGERSRPAMFVRWASPTVAVVKLEKRDSNGGGTGEYGSEQRFYREQILSLYRKADGSSVADPAVLAELEQQRANASNGPSVGDWGAAARAAGATPAPVEAPKKKRGRVRDELIYQLAEKPLDELRAMYAEIFGRPTKADHARVLAWRIVKAKRAIERGEDPRAGMPTPRGSSVCKLTTDQARAIVKLAEHLAGGKVKIGAMPPLAPLLAFLEVA